MHTVENDMHEMKAKIDMYSRNIEFVLKYHKYLEEVGFIPVFRMAAQQIGQVVRTTRMKRLLKSVEKLDNKIELANDKIVIDFYTIKMQTLHTAIKKL